MEDRRRFIKILTSWALALSWAPAASARAAAAAPAGEVFAGEFFIVNGWVLTRADLAALKIDAL